MKQQYLLNIDYNSESELNFNVSSNSDFNFMTISIGYILQTSNFTLDSKPIFIYSDLVNNECIGSICDNFDYGAYNFSKSFENDNSFKFYYNNLFNINQNIKLKFETIEGHNPSNIVGKIYILFEFIKRE
jgi:hypothetical protein